MVFLNQTLFHTSQSNQQQSLLAQLLKLIINLPLFTKSTFPTLIPATMISGLKYCNDPPISHSWPYPLNSGQFSDQSSLNPNLYHGLVSLSLQCLPSHSEHKPEFLPAACPPVGSPEPSTLPLHCSSCTAHPRSLRVFHSLPFCLDSSSWRAWGLLSLPTCLGSDIPASMQPFLNILCQRARPDPWPPVLSSVPWLITLHRTCHNLTNYTCEDVSSRLTDIENKFIIAEGQRQGQNEWFGIRTYKLPYMK